MNYLGITEVDVSQSKDSLKAKIKKAVAEKALDHLLQLADTHSKVRGSLYSNMDGMEYTRDPRFTPETVNMLFKFRTRMHNVKNNFRNNYKQSSILCPLCNVEDDTQEHLFVCQAILERCDVLQSQESEVAYEDIFSPDVNILLKVAHVLKVLVKTRADLEEEMLNS